MRTVGALFFIQKKRDLSSAHFFVLPRKSLFAIVPFCRCKLLHRFAQYFARLFCVFFGDLYPSGQFLPCNLRLATLLPKRTLRLFCKQACRLRCFTGVTLVSRYYVCFCTLQVPQQALRKNVTFRFSIFYSQCDIRLRRPVKYCSF